MLTMKFCYDDFILRKIHLYALNLAPVVDGVNYGANPGIRCRINYGVKCVNCGVNYGVSYGADCGVHNSVN